MSEQRLSESDPAPPCPGPTQRPTNGQLALRHARRLVVLVIGGTVAAFGVAMLVLPGPGILGILLGVTILASEFGWARNLLKRARRAAGLDGPDEGPER